LLLCEAFAVKRQQRGVLQPRQCFDRLHPHLVVGVGRQAHQGRRVKIGWQPPQLFKRLQDCFDAARFVEGTLEKGAVAARFRLLNRCPCVHRLESYPQRRRVRYNPARCECGVWQRVCC
jgi:hypothetical protein